jgi:hypothetical protein
MAGTNGTEGLSIQDLAAQMLGLTQDPGTEDNGTQQQGTPEPQAGHPAWQAILDNVAPENREAVMEQLHEWDAGVSRRFQKIHDEYAPLKAFEELGDPDDIKQAVEVYQALLDNPKDTWETIGRVYGLSLGSNEEEEEDEDYANLPPAIKERLAKLDEHEQVLGALVRHTAEEQAAAEQAQEDAALEDYLQELADEFGPYDEDFVIGLIAAGIDGEEAVGRYQQIVGANSAPVPTPTPAATPAATQRAAAPQVMSGSGGIPTSGSVELGKLTSNETQRLVMEALKFTKSDD